MVIHFPSALFPMDFLFSVANIYFPGNSLELAGYYSLLAGVAGGWIALLTGFTDFFLRILKHGPQAINRGLLHAAIQSTMLFSFTAILSLEYHHSDYVTFPPLWLWAVKIALLGLLIFGNYIGGELVFKYIAKEFHAGNNPS